MHQIIEDYSNKNELELQVLSSMTSIYNLTEMAVNYWTKSIYPADQPMMDMNTTYFIADLNHHSVFSAH